MDRRDFLKTLATAGSLAALPHALARAESHATAAAAGPESRAAWDELLQSLSKAQAHYLSPEFRIERPSDIADGVRYLLHVLHQGLDTWLDSSAEAPLFTRIVSPRKKALGDNPDAVYFTARVSPDASYRVRGNLAGATYTSFTLEGGNADGSYPKRSAGAINDTALGADADGNYELILSSKKQPGTWLELPDDVGTITTRHYFERETSAAADPTLTIPLSIENLDSKGPPPSPDDASIAAGIRRVRNFFEGVAGIIAASGQAQLPWVSTQPNVFKQPAKWDATGGGFGAVDNAYAMAPYLVMPDQALVIRGRFPECRFSNVVLWNRFLQTYDYVNRRISLNRVQTQQGPDGAFQIVIAHRDPGVPNWIDAEGRVSGIVYWRFMLPETEIAPLEAKLVPISEVAKG